MFRYSTLGGGENVPVRAPSELIEIVRARGLVLHCFEDALSLGFFLAESGSLTEPEVDIVLGGQVQERWPRQLFVDPALGIEALDYFLETGKQKGTLHWMRTDAFSRETVWKGRAGREAWEKGQERGGRA